MKLFFVEKKISYPAFSSLFYGHKSKSKDLFCNSIFATNIASHLRSLMTLNDVCLTFKMSGGNFERTVRVNSSESDLDKRTNDEMHFLKYYFTTHATDFIVLLIILMTKALKKAGVEIVAEDSFNDVIISLLENIKDLSRTNLDEKLKNRIDESLNKTIEILEEGTGFSSNTIKAIEELSLLCDFEINLEEDEKKKSEFRIVR